MTEREALKLALEALENGLCYVENEDFDNKQRFRGYEHLMPTDAAESIQEIKTAITAIKAVLEAHEALAQLEQRSVSEHLEPVAWMYEQARYGPTDLRGQQWRLALSRLKPWNGNGLVRNVQALYTTPPQRTAESEDKRTWVGLTKEEVSEIAAQGHQRWLEFYYAIEAKLKAKNFASSEGFKEKNT